MPYIPHTSDDIESMLSSLELKNIDTLFDEIPSSLLCGEFATIPEGISEMHLRNETKTLADKNQSGVCFMGAGSYDHFIPAAVWDIASRGEFLTAYTPYQAEASQGTLQLLYEFQTMIAELMALDVANASMYDGASALAEAVFMAIRLNKDSKSKRVLVPETLHPFYRQTLNTMAAVQHIELITLPVDPNLGITARNALDAYQGQDIAALIIPQPNFFGCLEDVDALTDWTEANQCISIACVNPLSLALLTPPGEWGQNGVDIACGEGQPLGVPMASGGPYFGFFSTRLKHVRQMPGRLIGRTHDQEGKEGFTLTLQAREQHIRRSKAMSNICTNQGLLVTAATVYMSLLGAEGMLSVARKCHANTNHLLGLLTEIDGVKPFFQSPFFHEVVIQLPKPVDEVLKKLRSVNILGGYPIEPHYPQFKNSLLLCATEMRTEEDMKHYADSLNEILSQDETGPSC